MDLTLAREENWFNVTAVTMTHAKTFTAITIYHFH